MTFIARTLLSASVCLFGAAAARADVAEVHFAQEFSMGYLQLNVIKHEHFLEKRAEAAGHPGLKVSWTTFNGANHLNDALLTGAVDFVAGGVPGFLIAWGKTQGRPQEIRGVTALGVLPLYLNTRNPNLKSIRDLGPGNKITVPAVRAAAQAIVLEMAAEKEFGPGQWGKLDPLTVALGPVDATTGILSAAPDFDCAFSTPPYQSIQLKDPRIHTILNTADIIGDSTVTVLWTSKKFHDANPIVYKAMIDALKDASDFIAQNRLKAVTYFTEDSGAKITAAEIDEILNNPQYKYTVTPKGTVKWAEFMRHVEILDKTPAAWTDLFFPEIADLSGS